MRGHRTACPQDRYIMDAKRAKDGAPKKCRPKGRHGMDADEPPEVRTPYPRLKRALLYRVS